MKKVAILLLSIITISVNAQTNRNCVTPISNYLFSQKLSSVKSQRNEDQRLRVSKLVARDNCLSTEQVKQIAELFQNDYNRLAFVQDAYKNTTDKDNFYEVYNTFMYFSTVFRLHDYIAGMRENKEVPTEEPENDQLTFPNIQYPDYRRYFGKTGCKNIFNDEQFMMLAERVFDEKLENRKLSIANQSLYNRCFLTAQAMKMASLLKSEENRLTFLKNAYSKVYDPDNYKYAHQLFENANYKQEIQKLAGGNVVIVDEKPPCEVNDKEFQDIKNRINKENFNNTKINLAKQIIRSEECFTTSQITQLVKLFRYSDSQMEIAKFAYDYTTDKDNYYKVADVFSFTSDKDKFLNYIKEKGR
jgi:hypothetical protein